VVLAIVTAVVDAGGAGQPSSASASATLAAYRPALALITAVAVVGMLVALSGLRSRPVRQAELAAGLADGGPANDLTDALAAGCLAPGDRADGELVGCPALQQAADVADGGTAA
jgi:hypothetical protein